MPTTCPADILTNTRPDPTTVACNLCGSPVAIRDDVVLGVAKRYGVTCDICADAAARETTARALAANRERRQQDWAKLCPPDFLATEPHRLPSPSKLQRVLAWQYGPRGLVLHGLTGKGKSRCAWELLKREFLAGRSVRVIKHDLQFRYSALFDQGAGAVARWANGIVAADLLLVDDVFKVKLTDSVEAALFSVVASRAEARRPIIATLNDTGDTLAARLSQDRGESLVRHLVGREGEYAEAIAFA